MPTETPERLTTPIRAFCQKLNHNVAPVYVPITAEPDAQKNECFFNVRRKVERDGGEIVHG